MQIIVEQNGNGRSALATREAEIRRLLIQIIPLTSIISRAGSIFDT